MRILWATTLLLWGPYLLLLVWQLSFLSHLLWALREDFLQFSLQALCICSNRSISFRQGLTGPEPTLVVPNKNYYVVTLEWLVFISAFMVFLCMCFSAHSFTDRWQFAFEVAGLSISRYSVTFWGAKLGPVHLLKHASVSLPCCASLAAE